MLQQVDGSQSQKEQEYYMLMFSGTFMLSSCSGDQLLASQ